MIEPIEKKPGAKIFFTHLSLGAIVAFFVAQSFDISNSAAFLNFKLTAPVWGLVSIVGVKIYQSSNPIIEGLGEFLGRLSLTMAFLAIFLVPFTY